MTVMNVHDTGTTEENGPLDIVGKYLTAAFKLLKWHLPDLLTAKEATPSDHGVFQPVSLSQTSIYLLT